MYSLITGAVLISFAPIFVKYVDLGPTLIGAYRCLLGAAMFSPFVWASRGARAAKPKAGLVLAVIGAGGFFALDLAFWHRSIEHAGAGMATILANTQVFFLTLFAYLFLGERPDRRFLISVPLAFAGVALLAYKPRSGFDELFSTLGIRDYHWGIIAGLIAAVTYSAFLLCLKRVERLGAGVPVSAKLGLISLVAGASLAATAGYEGTLQAPTAEDLLWLLALAASAQVAGWVLITRGLTEVRISLAGLVLLLQPVLATVMSHFLFKERFEPHQIAGAAITLVAVYLGSTRRR